MAALIVGGGLGWAIDAYLLESAPWGLLVGLVFGLAAGIRSVYRSVQRWQVAVDNSNNRE